MGISAIIGGVSAIGGIASSVIGAGAASDAANAQVQAANEAAQTQLQMYNQTRQDLMPWQTTGQAANQQLAMLYGINPATPGTPGTNAYNHWGINIPGTPGTPGTPAGSGIPNYQAMSTALENTPGYQFTRDQGLQALDRSAASRGLLLSGGQLKDAQTFGQGLAMSNAWNPYIAQLNALSTAGQNSAAKTGELGAGYAGNIGSAQLAGGTAAANGSLAGATALQGGIAQGTNLLQTLYGSSYGGSGAAAAAYGASPGAIADPGGALFDPYAGQYGYGGFGQ